MYALFRAEFQRYQQWAVLAFLSQLGIWAFAARLGSILEISSVMRSLSYLAIIIICLAVGGLQMYLHRRKNHWVFLIQRPLANGRIYLALAAAAFALLAIAIPLAWLLMVGGIDIFTDRVVDARHYLHGLFSFCAGLCAYLIGSLIVLSASRGACLLVGLLALVLTNVSANTTLAFLIGFALVGLLLYLNARSFNSDPQAHLSDGPAIALMSIPMQFGIVFLLVLSTGFFYHVPRFLLGNHPDNNPIEGSYSYLWKIDENERAAYLLRDSDRSDVDMLVRQTGLADLERLHTSPERFAERGQLHFLDEQSSLEHKATNTHWAFSHDEMLLQGNHTVTGDVTGYFGRDGFLSAHDEVSELDRFLTVPFLIGERFLQTRTHLFEVDFDDRILSIKFALPDGAQFVTRPEFRQNVVALISAEYLYLFDPQQFAEVQTVATPDYEILHPDTFSRGAFVELYRMVDGYLAVYHSAHLRQFDVPGAELLFASLGGEIEQLHVTEFTVPVHPAPIAHLDFILSPLLHTAKLGLFRWIKSDTNATRSRTAGLAVPSQLSVYVTIVLTFMVALAGVVFFARRARLRLSRTVVWASLTALFGLPAFVSFLLMNRLPRALPDDATP